MEQSSSPPNSYTKQQLVEMAKSNTTLRLLEEDIHSRNVATKYSEITAKYQIYLRNIKRKYLTIFLVCLGAIGITIMMIIVDVYLRFGDVVSMFNKHRQSYMPSGFDLGLALRVPALTKWLNFRTKAMPEAIYISYKSQNMNPYFMKDPGQNLISLFSTALWLSGSADPSAMTLVCNSWVAASGQGVRICENPCPPGSKGYASTYISDGLSTVANMAMMGGMGYSGIFAGLAMGGMSVANTFGAFGGDKNSHCIGSDSLTFI